jgi:hypothetical protein
MDRLTKALPSALLFALSFAFRLPELVHADEVNSDAAVVGLQAMHLARGEISPFLWGSGYQTSTDSFVAMLFFAPLGATPFALKLSALSLHVLLTFFAFWTLRRRLPEWIAFVITLPLVFTPAAVHSYALNPPRQASLTLAFAAFFALDSCSASARPLLLAALGGALASLAPFADPYALLLAPLVGLFGLLCARDGGASPAVVARRAGAQAAGAIAGAIPLLLLWRHPGAKHGVTTMTMDVVPRTWRLFLDPCLPWALSTKPFTSDGAGYYPWEAPAGFRVVQWIGAAVFVAGMLAGIALFFVRRIPWEVRRVGLVGGLGLPLTSVAFLGSTMVMDHFSMRYLAAIVLMSPFAFAPAAWLARARPARVGVLLAPYLASAAVGGWVSFGADVRGAWIAPRPPRPTDEEKLEEALATRGIKFAMGDYWASYRLSFVMKERVVFVPKHAAEDRYPPHRAAFGAAPSWAYVFDPLRSRESLAETEQELRQEDPGLERLTCGRYTVFIVHRVPHLFARDR